MLLPIRFNCSNTTVVIFTASLFRLVPPPEKTVQGIHERYNRLLAVAESRNIDVDSPRSKWLYH